MRRHATGMLLGALLLLAQLPSVVAAQEVRPFRSAGQTASQVTTVESAKDEARKNYFALRAVTYLQRQLTANPNQLPLEILLAGVKTAARKLVNTFDDEKVDADIRSMATDLVDFTEQYETFLADSKLINARFAAKLANDSPGLLWDILVEGVGQTVSESIKSLGDSGDVEVLIVAEVVGFGIEQILNYLRDLYSKDQLNRERYEELSAASNKLTDIIIRNQNRHLKLVKQLREKYGWPQIEVGFDASEDETAPFRKRPTEAGNVEARIRSLKAWKERRKHDPFAALEHAQLTGHQLMATLPKEPTELAKNAKALLALARSCREAAGNVPEGTAFDSYRLALLRQGGHLGNNGAARSNIAAVGCRYGCACKDAAIAVGCWQACLKAAKDDDDGFLRMRLAIAIGLQGDLDEAQKRAAKVADLRRLVKCPLYASNMAAISCRLGKTDEAIDWLEFGVRKCGLVVVDLTKDADFAGVCHDYAERIDRLAHAKK